MKKLLTPKILVLLFLLACASFLAACQEEENECLQDDIDYCQDEHQDCMSGLDSSSATYVEDRDSCVSDLCDCLEAAGCVIDDTFECGD